MSLFNWYTKQTKYKESDRCKKYEDYIYLFYSKDSKMYKVGISKDPHERLHRISLQSGMRIDLVMSLKLQYEYDESARYIEKKIHEYYKEDRVFGEWFKFSKYQLSSIRHLLYEIEGEEIIDNFK